MLPGHRTKRARLAGRRGGKTRRIAATRARRCLSATFARRGARYISSRRPKQAKLHLQRCVTPALAMPLRNKWRAGITVPATRSFLRRRLITLERRFRGTWLRSALPFSNASAVGSNTSVVDSQRLVRLSRATLLPPLPQRFGRTSTIRLQTMARAPRLWRQKKWNPGCTEFWAALRNSRRSRGPIKNSYVIKAGGGAEYRWTPRPSFGWKGLRAHGFFKQGQHNFQLAVGSFSPLRMKRGSACHSEHPRGFFQMGNSG